MFEDSCTELDSAGCSTFGTLRDDISVRQILKSALTHVLKMSLAVQQLDALAPTEQTRVQHTRVSPP